MHTLPDPFGRMESGSNELYAFDSWYRAIIDPVSDMRESHSIRVSVLGCGGGLRLFGSTVASPGLDKRKADRRLSSVAILRRLPR